METGWLGEHGVAGGGIVTVCFLCRLLGCAGPGVQGPHAALSNFQRAKGFPAAGDFRRAMEVCRADVSERPSASSYVALPSVYHALDACLDSLAEADRWVAVELLAQSLPAGGPKELLDSPDMLPRIAKALTSSSVRLDE